MRQADRRRRWNAVLRSSRVSLCWVVVACASSSAQARAADAASSAPASAQAVDASAAADAPATAPAAASEPAVSDDDEIPPELIAFLGQPGVTTTALFGFDVAMRHLAVWGGAANGFGTGCLVGMATPIALSLVSPMLGGPRFDFAEVGGPWWAMLPGAAIGVTLTAPLWAAGEGLKYEHQRGQFLGPVFPAVDEDAVPATIYRDAATAIALGVVSAALPLGAGVGLMALGTTNPGSPWHLASLPFFASAMLLAPAVTSSLYTDYAARDDPFLRASRAASEQQIRAFLELLEKQDSDEAARDGDGDDED
jgi:hypothetical protein